VRGPQARLDRATRDYPIAIVATRRDLRARPETARSKRERDGYWYGILQRLAFGRSRISPACSRIVRCQGKTIRLVERMRGRPKFALYQNIQGRSRAARGQGSWARETLTRFLFRPQIGRSQRIAAARRLEQLGAAERRPRVWVFARAACGSPRSSGMSVEKKIRTSPPNREEATSTKANFANSR